MTENNAPATEQAKPCFDVLVSMRADTPLDDVHRRALAMLSMPAEKADALIKALALQFHVKVGHNVSRERAQKALKDLQSIGLNVELKPVLSLEQLDTRMQCPHCDTHVEVGPDRMCPSCGRHVDRADPRRKLMARIEEEERRKIETGLIRDKNALGKQDGKNQEAALRARIRLELEKEYGLHQPWRKRLLRARTGVVVSVLLTLTLGAGLGGGVALQAFANGEFMSGTSKRLSNPLDEALHFLDSRQAHVQAAAQQAASGASVSAQNNGLGVASGENSLVALAAAERTQGGTASLEQTLAQTPWGTAVIDGTVVAPKGGMPMLQAGDQQQLTQDFALHLAQMGQSPRAREILAAMAARGGAGGVDASSAVLVEAWSMNQPGAPVTQARIQALRAQALSIADPVDQVRALAGSAAALSQSGQLPGELAESLMKDATQTLNGLTDPTQRASAIEVWYTAMGDVLNARLLQRASAGDLSYARIAANQLDALRRQAPIGASSAHLGGMLYQSMHLIGMEAQARQVLADTLRRGQEIKEVFEQAEFLRQFAQSCGNSVPDELLAAAAALSRKVADAPVGERNRAYLSLARLAVLSGQPASAQQWQQQAQIKLPTDRAERARLQAQWLVREQLDLSARAQRAGRIAESERYLRKAAAYLM